MPTVPISAMPAATVFADTDVFPIVQGGINKKCTRTVFMTAGPGELVAIGAGGSTFTIAVDGSTVLNGNTLFLNTSFGPTLSVDVNGEVTIAAYNGFPLHLVAGAFSIDMDPVTGISFDGVPFLETVWPFPDADPTFWTDPVPTTVSEALNRLAEQFFINTGQTVVTPPP